MNHGLHAMQEALDGQPPVGFEDLPEDSLSHLALLIGQARESHAQELWRATEESLRFIPRLLRPAVRKIVGL